ncbi:MAG: caspase family protein [Cyanobacteria bacterium J06639_14]
MANQWALLIGINQYTALQPLMYAQADAIGLRNFFVDELGIPVDHCTLLTDMSVSVEPYAHAPSRTAIETQLERLCRDKVEPGDLLWIFFSGYGLSNAGQDYWLAIDAEPMKLAETAIAVTTIFDILKTARTDQILLTLDVNRSQGAIGHQNIGQQTLALANDFGIATVMSCQPEQYAHETMAIRHGLFTKALLEGVRYHGCVTASQLAAYLSDRVPELSQHHWRPMQNPVAVIPSARKFMMVVPPDGLARLPVTENVATEFSAADFPSATNTDFTSRQTIGTTSATATQPPVTPPAANLPVPAKPEVALETVADAASDTKVPSTSMALVPVPSKPLEEEEEEKPTTTGLWQWLALAGALGILAGVLINVFNILDYLPVQFARIDEADSAQTAEDPSPEGAPSDEATPDDVTAADEPTSGPESNGEAVSEENGDGTTETTPQTPSEGPEPADAEAAGATAPETEAATVPGAPLFSNNVDPTAVGESALQRAEAAIAANRYGEAREWLQLVPPELQDQNYETLLQQANSEVADAAVRNQQILDNARRIIQPSSASLFNDAIEQARQVPTDDPYYDEAQEEIALWSQVILDIAEGRANNGDVQGALAAAALVPEDQTAVYQQAQQRMAAWQKQTENQQLIQQMQNSLQPGQASSFQDAISALMQITPDQPGYATAQERISQWSKDILAIARTRAAQGNINGAIAAAQLVPEGTESFAEAQVEIQRWQGQL